MRRLSIWCRIYLALVGFSVCGLVLTRTTGMSPGLIEPVVSALTLLFGAATLYFTASQPGVMGRASLAFAFVLILGTAVELSGLYYGIPFGRYAYTDNWVPTVDLPQGKFFPLLLPVAWVLVAGGTALSFTRTRWFQVLLIALVATLLDFFMEFVMTQRLDYWKWLEAGPLPGGAPLMNSVGWYATSCLAAAIIYWLVPKNTPTREPRLVLVAYALLMLAVAILHPPTA